MAKPKKADPGDGCLNQRVRRKNGRVYRDSYVILSRDPDGKIVRIPLNTKDYNEAKEKLRQWQVARAAGDNSAIDGRITVIQFLERWMLGKEKDSAELGKPRPSSITKYKNDIKTLVAFLLENGYEFLQIREMTDRYFREFQAWRLKQTRFGKPGGVLITPEGINRAVDFYGSIFTAAYHDRLIPKDPMRGVVPLPTAAKKIALPNAEMLWEVFQQMDDPVARDYAATVALTGQRAMEAMTRKFRHVDLERRILHICDDGDFRLKTAKSARDIPLPNEVADIVRRIISERKCVTPDDYVFIMPDGSPLKDHDDHVYHKITRTLAAINRARRRAGICEIPYFHVRLLRHWFISWALNRPVNPLTEIQLIKVVGHADFEMIRNTYYHLDIDGESGRKMRETPLFAGMNDASVMAPTDGANPDDQLMFNFSLRGA